MTLPNFFTKATFLLLFASSVSAFDEYLPIDPKMLELKATFAKTTLTGAYNGFAAVKETSFIFDDSYSHEGELLIKYGLVNRLDVALSLNYVNSNTFFGTSSGFAQPSFGLKYAVPDDGYSMGGFMKEFSRSSFL